MRRGLFLIIITIGLVAAAVAGDPAPQTYEPALCFRTRILPILDRRCFECHSEAEGQDDGGLVLDSRSGWMRGGNHSSPAVPESLQKSLLIRSIRGTDPGRVCLPMIPLPLLEIALLQGRGCSVPRTHGGD